MNQFTKDDLLGRIQFKKEFKNYYIFQDTGEYDHTDLMLTACTKNTCYNIELKKRNYPIEDLSGSTILEKTKLDAFREAYREDPSRCLIYFNYYLTGSWIAFDMTDRIKYGVGLDSTGTMMLPSNTSACGELVNKEVVYLAYCQDIFRQDKIRIR
jgi:hypothetical protein